MFSHFAPAFLHFFHSRFRGPQQTRWISNTCLKGASCSSSTGCIATGTESLYPRFHRLWWFALFLLCLPFFLASSFFHTSRSLASTTRAQWAAATTAVATARAAKSTVLTIRGHSVVLGAATSPACLVTRRVFRPPPLLQLVLFLLLAATLAGPLRTSGHGLSDVQHQSSRDVQPHTPVCGGKPLVGIRCAQLRCCPATGQSVCGRLHRLVCRLTTPPPQLMVHGCPEMGTRHRIGMCQNRCRVQRRASGS